MSASREEEEALSPDELRKRLYQTFKSKGLLDTLKTQLRNQLIQELNHPPLGHGKVPSTVKSDSGIITVCNRIVADYLRTSGYEYSLSVFFPESGLNKDKTLTKQDLLHVVKISPESSLFKALVSQENCDKSFLTSLLVQLSSPTLEQTHDVMSQTTSMSTYGESLVEKMKIIDKEYENHDCRGERIFTLQSKMESYKKEIEKRLQAEMKVKLQHFKDVEIAKMQMAENAKFNKDFDKLKHELEETYAMKAKALMEREKNAIARLQKQQEIEEKNLYIQRQDLLKEIEAVRNRESELRIKIEAFEKNGQIHEEKVKTTVELLRRREMAVKTLEDTHDQRLRNELSRYQLELKEEFVKRTEKLTENETQNKMETARILKESAELDAKLEEHIRVCSELKQLKVELNTAQQQLSLLSEQKELLKEKLETMSDYTSLKTDRVELQGQLRLMSKQLEEALEESSHLRADMLHIQTSQRRHEEEFDQQKQVLQAQLQSEVERSARLMAQLMESEEKAKWMNNYVDDIKMQLQQTQQALENEVLRNPKPSLVDRSVLEICPDNLVPPDIYVDRSVLKAESPYDFSKADGSLPGPKSPWGNTLDSDMDLIADAKARMLELQREAETLEEAYRNYQQRAVVSNISHMLVSRPLSPQYLSHRPDSPVRRPPPRLLSPKTTKTPPLTSYDTRKPQESQTKVTFLESPSETVPSGFVVGHGVHPLTDPIFQRDLYFKDESPIQPRHTSPTQMSPSRKKDQRIIEAPLTALAEDPLLSRHKAVSSGNFLSELSPPQSPQLRSTARDMSSPPKLKPAVSSSESSPQPEKISLEDLTELLPDSQSSVGQEQQQQQEEEDEEQRWEQERRERHERRLREQEEAKERELQDLERLEKEHLLQEEEQTAQKEEVTDAGKSERQGDVLEALDNGKELKAEENPLEKYMKMILEAREKQQPHQSPEQEAKPMSFEDKTLSEKDDSIVAYSHKDEDDDFGSIDFLIQHSLICLRSVFPPTPFLIRVIKGHD
uniref:OFD1 centriole and centriolar satellite protein n=1 Tax=Neogobius melanostomus TaxID=47308 RepID=A0A8C6TZB8_9GOBI